MEQKSEWAHGGTTTYGVLASAWRPAAPTTHGYPPGPISFKSLCSFFEYTTGETFISVTQEQFNQLSLSEPALVRPGGYHAVKPFAGEVGSIGRFRIFISVDWGAEHAKRRADSPEQVKGAYKWAWEEACQQREEAIDRCTRLQEQLDVANQKLTESQRVNKCCDVEVQMANRRAGSWVKAARDLARTLGLADEDSGERSHRDWAWIERFALNYKRIRENWINCTELGLHGRLSEVDRVVEARRKADA